MSNIDKYREATRKTDQAYRQVFLSPDGRQVLEDLQQIFGAIPKDTDSAGALQKIGQLQVLSYIETRCGEE